MYDLTITKLAVDSASRSQKWPLQYHSVAQTDSAKDLLDGLYDEETNQLVRPLTEEESRWIQNERSLAALDWRYWASHYASIVDWSKRVTHFTPNVAQEILLAVWAEAESQGLAIMVQSLKARQLGVCLVPSTRILTADLRWVAIDDVQVGERLVGVDEYPCVLQPNRKKRLPRQMRTATVEAKIDRVHETWTLVLDTGVEITGTGEHPLLCEYQSQGTMVSWKRIQDIKPGDHIRTLTPVWEAGDYEDAWLGGLIDGEGCLRPKKGAGVELSVSQVSGAVLDRARAVMRARYANVREEVDRRDPGTSSKLGSKEVHKLVVGRTGDLFRLLGRTRPTRFIGMSWWEGKELPGKRIGRQWATVLSKRPAGRQRVVDLQTSTGTYIAEGVVSHNTTLTELAIAHRVEFTPYTTAAVASADPKKTVEMQKMIAFCWEMQPWWLAHKPTKIEKGMPVEFGDIHTSILVQAGNQFHGVARGQTPNCFHVSEVSSWNNAEEDIEASLLKAIHENADVFGMLESTALGRDNWWYENWQVIKVDYPRGRSRIRPVFLPWFVGIDLYPTKADLRARPVPPTWIPSDRTVNHATRARDYVLASPYLLRYLAHGNPDWQLPREQMWYYEIEYDAAKRKGHLNKFLSELPADDEEAFQSTAISVIDQEVVQTYKEKVRNPLGVYAIVGDGIHQSLVPPRSQWWVGPDAPPIITIKCAEVLRSAETYQFIPLKFEGYPSLDPMFKLFIYEWPEQDVEYGQGVDTGDGIGQDWSVIEGIAKGDALRHHRQVFEFASPYIKADQLWPMSLALAVFYSTFQSRLGRRSQSRVAVECRGNGEICQKELQNRGWINFHPWKRYDRKKPMRTKDVHQWGVFTNVWFRSMMMDRLLTIIDEECLDIGSPWFVSEMATLERDVDEQSARAAYKTHDDRIMALGFILFSMTIDDMPGKASYRRTTPNYLPESLIESGGYGVRGASSSPSTLISTGSTYPTYPGASAGLAHGVGLPPAPTGSHQPFGSFSHPRVQQQFRRLSTALGRSTRRNR